MKMCSDVNPRVGTPHIKMCSDVHHRVRTQHMKMCSDVNDRVGTPHMKCVQILRILVKRQFTKLQLSETLISASILSPTTPDRASGKPESPYCNDRGGIC